MMSPAGERNVADLLEVLDADIRHLESTLLRLDALRSLLIKRDDAALQKLLGELPQEADRHRVNEQRRQQLRRDLAADLGCAESDLTLSRLQRELPGPTRAAVADRQARLRSLAERLKREYTLTVLLVRDCTRFNQTLLNIFLGSAGRGLATYSPTGAAQHAASSALMSMQL
jgi:hypothetical protein